MSRLILLLLKGMDKSPGVGMVFLTKNGIADKTIILFLSDNGGLSLSPPRQKPFYSHNLPLRAGKGSVYEGGIRIPHGGAPARVSPNRDPRAIMG